MNNNQRDNVIADYSRTNLSPTEQQRDKVSARYKELCGFIGPGCFQAGFYARFTAVRPPHDLDVIWVWTDVSFRQNPRTHLAELAERLRASYKAASWNVKITVQEHSINIEFLDDPDGFSIDVVPAIESSKRNEYGKPLYLVPQILRMSRIERKEFKDPIEWILSDPRGYIVEATGLDEATEGVFRKVAKVVKAWKQKQKALDDAFKLKSFHLEQMVVRFLKANTHASILEALTAVFGEIPRAVEAPAIPDRADPKVYIDQYVCDDLTPAQRGLIKKLAGDAFEILTRIECAESDDEVRELLAELTNVKTKPSFVAPAVLIPSPQKPYAEDE